MQDLEKAIQQDENDSKEIFASRKTGVKCALAIYLITGLFLKREANYPCSETECTFVWNDTQHTLTLVEPTETVNDFTLLVDGQLITNDSSNPINPFLGGYFYVAFYSLKHVLTRKA